MAGVAAVMAVVALSVACAAPARSNDEPTQPSDAETPTAVADPTQASSPQRATVVIQYEPPAFDTSSPDDGECWIHSIATDGRDGSYRCVTSHIIYDPCFTSGTQIGFVICPRDPRDPLEDEVMRVDPSTLPVSAVSAAGGTPWFFVTVDEIVCGRFTGTLAPTPFGVAPYGCRNPATGVGATACFDPVAEGDVWSVRCYDDHAGSDFTQNVATVWY